MIDGPQYKPVPVTPPAPLIPVIYTAGMDVSRAVKLLRLARGLSQRDLGARMHTHRTYVAKIENGTAVHTIPNFCRIAAALEVSARELAYFAAAIAAQAPERKEAA